MPRKSTSKKLASPKRSERRETQATEALTVAWMLTVMSTVLAEVALMGAVWWVWADPDQDAPAALALVLSSATLIMGALSLLLTPLVWRMRREKPPRGVVAFAVLIGAAPLVALLLQGLF